MKHYPILFSCLIALFSVISLAKEYRLYQGNEFIGTVSLVDTVEPNDNNIIFHDCLTESQKRAGEYLKFFRSQRQHKSERNLSRHQYPHFFAQQRRSIKQILERIDLYDRPEFIAFIKHFEEYGPTIKALHNKLKDLSFVERCSKWCFGEYSAGLAKTAAQLNREVEIQDQQVLSAPDISGTEKIDYFLRHEIDYHKFVQKCSHIAHQTLQKYEHEHDAVHCLIENALERLQQKVISDQQIVFNLAVVNRTVSTLEGMSAERAAQLFKRGITTFITHLNPVTQVTGLIDAVIGTAHFITDITIGRLYLSSEQYHERINQIHNVFELLSVDTLASLTAEQIVDFIAIAAAESVTSLGMATSVKFIKRVKALEAAQKVGSKAQGYARSFKDKVHRKYAQQGYRIHPDGTVSLFSEGSLSKSSCAPKHLPFPLLEKQLRMVEKKIVDEAMEEVNKIRHKYDFTRKGYGDRANKYIKLSYEHIFGIEISLTKKEKFDIHGFHLDRTGYLERQQMMDFRHRYQDVHGYYRAQLWHNGHCVKKDASFFPAHWTVEQAVDAIFEAYDYFIENGAKVLRDTNGVHKIQGKTSTGHIIEMIISPGGRIITAYPIVIG